MVAPSAAPRKPGAGKLTRRLLAWYDANQRDLPWRARPGETADPYAVWLSEIMLQQTTVVTAAPYYAKFLARWPSVGALAAAPLEEVMEAWAGLGYYARARNLHACARAVNERHGGRIPREEAALLALPGVGPYTAAAVAAIAFDRPCVAQDGNVERVIARLFAIETPLPRAKREINDKARLLLPLERPGDFAQALMDLGAMVCVPRGPACGACPFETACAAQKAGAPEAFPVKAEKPAKPRRQGAVFILRRGESVALQRRPPKGLLGGMTAFPATPLAQDTPPAEALAHAPLAAPWRPLEGILTHVFTHFSLDLTVFTARAGAAARIPPNCRWAPRAGLDKEGLPTLMRKAAVRAGLMDPRTGE